jgi:hypothetical protein
MDGNERAPAAFKSGMELTRLDTTRFDPIFSSFGQKSSSFGHKKGTNTVEQLFYFHHSRRKKTLEIVKNASVNVSSFER